MTGVRIATVSTLHECPRYRIFIIHMKLILVRHGETIENKAHITQGHLNSQLTKNGLSQAKKVARRLSQENIDIAYSSDLDRCIHTAREILKYHPHVQLILSPQLREQAKGQFEGKPSVHWHDTVKNSGQAWYRFLPDLGETMKMVQQRTRAFVKKILAKHSQQTVLLVGHGGPLTSLYLLLLKKKFEEYRICHPQNTAVTILEIKSLKLATFPIFNCIKHLS